MSDSHSVQLEIELLTDACITQTNRSLGEPSVATCIPGRLLWGVAANRFYQGGHSDAEAFRLFHQGAVRFPDAVPLALHEGRVHRTYPVPRAWHEPKGQGSGLQHGFFNFCRKDVREQQEGKRCKPVDPGWVMAPTSSGDSALKAIRVPVKTAYTLRTAVDPTGHARDGLLFGLPAIRAGTRFCSTIIGPKNDVEKVVDLLVKTEIQVGRSRNAEMGLALCVRSDRPIHSLAHGGGTSKTASILLVSRAVFIDSETGAPTFVPSPVSFGLGPGWVYDTSASFLRTTRIVPFNGRRCRPETERFALERGSVLTFSSEASQDLSGPALALAAGVGEYRTQGFGEVLLNPTLLTAPVIQESGIVHVRSEVKTPPPQDELFQWAKIRAEERKRALGLYKKAHNDAKVFRRYRIRPSQWGALHAMAREARFRRSDGLLQELNTYLGHGARVIDDSWKRAKEDLLKLCKAEGPRDLPLFLEHLSGACMRQAEEQGGDTR